MAIIEGAAGSGKTTTLRPIADLYREHGQSIIATAVAWRTAVALGNDVDARPFCVDKLLRLAARGGMEINKDTTIIVDEAGMLSSRQAHHILQLSERHGAKITTPNNSNPLRPIADLYRQNTDRALSPPPWPGARRWRLATTSMRGRSASTNCCASPHGVAVLLGDRD